MKTAPFTSISIFSHMLILIFLNYQGSLSGQEAYIPDEPMEDYQFITDRDLYIAGEDILFSFYCFQASEEKLDPLSKVAYIELFRADQKVISRGKFRLKDGIATGRLAIPEETKTSVYFIRGYTRYLRNFHPATFPLLTCTIVHPEIPVPKIENPSHAWMRAVPFGGILMDGSSADIALKFPEFNASAPDSIYLSGNGERVDAEVHLLDKGFGHLSFLPRYNVQYSIISKYETGDSSVLLLPAVKKEGLISGIRESEDAIIFFVRQKFDDTASPSDPLLLTVSSSQFATLYVDSTYTTDTVFDFHIPKDLLKPGVNYFTLHTPDGKMAGLQTFFLQKQPLLISLKPDKPIYASREKVTVEISSPQLPEDGIPVSVTVVKKGTLNRSGKQWQRYPLFFDNVERFYPYPNKKNTENSNLLSEVQNVFFREKVMEMFSFHPELTNSRKELVHIPEIRDVGLHGFVQSRNSNEPVAGTRVLLSYLGEGSHIQLNETQADGAFNFALYPNRKFQDLFLCTFEESSGNEILISNDFSPDFVPLSEQQTDLDTAHRKLLEELVANKQIHELKTSFRKADGDSISSTRLGFGTPDVSIRLEDYIDLPTMEVVLNEIVPYVKVRKRKGDYVLTILDPVTDLLYENHLIIVDDIPLNDLNELMQLHPAQVEQIDVINRTYVIGDFTFRGILFVTTRSSNFGGISIPPGAVFINYEMITQNQMLPQSISLLPEIDGFKQPDFRNVLYWHPNLKFTEQTSISFYTSDHRGTYEIVVRGRTRDGEVIFGSVEIAVP